MKEKVVIIGGKGTAVVIAEQIYDAHARFGMDIEVLGFAFDDPDYKDGINADRAARDYKKVVEEMAFSDYADDAMAAKRMIPKMPLMTLAKITPKVAAKVVLKNDFIIKYNYIIRVQRYNFF